jgi:hypothetical protein
MKKTKATCEQFYTALDELRKANVLYTGEWVVLLDPKKFESEEDKRLYAYYLEHFDELPLDK